MENLLDKESLLAKVEEHASVYPEQVTFESLYEAGMLQTVALLPKDFRARVKYLGNLFAQMCFGFKSEDPKLKCEMVGLATSLSYLLNSTSFEKDEYKDFDQAEIGRKLRREQL
jgi:hypothetical protein